MIAPLVSSTLEVVKLPTFARRSSTRQQSQHRSKLTTKNGRLSAFSPSQQFSMSWFCALATGGIRSLPVLQLLFETGQDGFVGWGQIVGWCAPDKFAQAGSMLTVLERATTDNCRENDFLLITFTLCPHNLLIEVV